VDMLRKLLLTSVLVVVYAGSAPHLAGSLLTTFLFILLHLQVHPYLNSGLNEFQRLALVTQFLTIFGGIIYLMTECLDQLHEVQPDPRNQVASELLAIFILVINWVTAVLYPLYRLILSLMESNGWLATLYQGLMQTCTRVLRVCRPSSGSTGGFRSITLEGSRSWGLPDHARHLGAVASAVALRKRCAAKAPAAPRQNQETVPVCDAGLGVASQVGTQETGADNGDGLLELAPPSATVSTEVDPPILGLHASQRGILQQGVFVPLELHRGEPTNSDDFPRLEIEAELGVLQY